jgi:CRP-like cAMP-binding protein
MPPRPTLLLEEGEVCERVYYLESGLARGFYCLGEEEITSWFVGAGSWMLAVTSFFTRKPSQKYIKLLEESTLLSIDFANLERIYDQFHEFNFIGRVLTEHYYGMSEQRSWALRRQTAMEQYHHLLRTDPGLFDRVPPGICSCCTQTIREPAVCLCRQRTSGEFGRRLR